MLYLLRRKWKSFQIQKVVIFEVLFKEIKLFEFLLKVKVFCVKWKRSGEYFFDIGIIYLFV